VPAEIIIAIIGVETRYGQHAGRYRVIDSLSTLAFDYPPRSKFFRSELKQYLLMTRDENVDPLSLYGSYAGAMGQPQFISSSYRRYAIDFDGDGKRDIWQNSADAIGSVANYLSIHGWQRGQPVTAQLTDKPGDASLLNRSLEPYVKVAELTKEGLKLPLALPDNEDVTLMSLEGAKGDEYWLGMNNFYVITRYNHSALYAMAVYQLSQAIRKKRYA
jgi:membrane-bound lytic murein transglycosylase B